MRGVIKVVNFKDKTDTEAGTSINRANLMAVQGFEDCDITIDEESVTEEYDNNVKVITEFNADGSISEKLYVNNIISIHKKITFNLDGTISEVLV